MAGLLAGGFAMFLCAKLSAIRLGRWFSFGTRHLSWPNKPLYVGGNALMACGTRIWLGLHMGIGLSTALRTRFPTSEAQGELVDVADVGEHTMLQDVPADQALDGLPL